MKYNIMMNLLYLKKKKNHYQQNIQIIYLSIIIDQEIILKSKKDKLNQNCIKEDIDSIELLSLDKPDNQINTIESINLLGEELPENIVEERDSINIPSLEKEENQVEYIDELFLE